jgi:hypothetical protein
VMCARQLSRFFDSVAGDGRITTTHIVLYVVLYELWGRSGFTDPFSISRSRVMKMSKIKGKTTYHNHMKDLVAFGFIKYEPSYHPRVGSLVWVLAKRQDDKYIFTNQ